MGIPRLDGLLCIYIYIYHIVIYINIYILKICIYVYMYNTIYIILVIYTYILKICIYIYIYKIQYIHLGNSEALVAHTDVEAWINSEFTGQVVRQAQWGSGTKSETTSI